MGNCSRTECLAFRALTIESWPRSGTMSEERRISCVSSRKAAEGCNRGMAVRKAPYRWRSDAFQKPMIGDRLEMYCPPVCAEDAFMPHLAERGMGEDGVHEPLPGGFELAGDDIAMDQLRHLDRKRYVVGTGG